MKFDLTHRYWKALMGVDEKSLAKARRRGVTGRRKALIRDILILTVIIAAAAVSQSKAYHHPSTYFLGDSLAVGTAPYIHVPMEVDGRISRPLAAGVAILKAHGHVERLMVSLFSNDSPRNVPELKRAVRLSLRRADCAVWATIHVGYLDYSAANRYLLRHAGKRLKIVDWDRAVRAHPELLNPDGVHPTAHGYYVRSRMYVSALHRCPHD